MSLFRAYNIPYTAYADTEGYYAVDYEELLATIRDEAVAYLEKETEAMKKMGVDKGSYIAKEGFAADEIISLGRKNPGQSDCDVHPGHRCETLGVGQRNGNGSPSFR